MNNFISRSLMRCSVREWQTQKCNLHIQAYILKKRPDFCCISSYSQRKYFLSNNFSTQNSPNVLVVNLSEKSRFSYISQSELRSGIINKSGLLTRANLHLPLRLNVRHESTSSEIVDSSIGSDVQDKSFYESNKEGLEYALKDMAESYMVSGFQECLEEIHNLTGLSWWGSIILSAIVLRTVIVLPFSMLQRQALVRLENAQRGANESMVHITREINLSMKKFGWPQEYAKTKFREMYKQELKDGLSREKVHPMTPCTSVVIQSTVWLSMTLAIGNMCCAFPHNDIANGQFYSELTTGGFGWMTNLTAVDSTSMLPYSVGLLNLIIVTMHHKGFHDPSVMQKFITGSFALVSVGMIPLAMQLPSGIVLYWAASSAYGLAVNLLLLSPRMKRIFKIEEIKPYSIRKKEAEERVPDLQDRLNVRNLGVQSRKEF